MLTLIYPKYHMEKQDDIKASYNINVNVNQRNDEREMLFRNKRRKNP